MLVGPRHVVARCPRSVGGTLNIRLQRQTVLQAVSGDRLRDQAGHSASATSAKRSCSRGRSPRCSTISEQCVRDVPYTVQRPCYRTVQRECRYTVQRPVSRTIWKDCTYTVCRPVRETHIEIAVVHGVPPGPRDHASRPASTTSARRSARSRYKDCAYTVCRPVQETVMKTVPYTVCRPVQETAYKNVHLHGLPPGPEDLLPVGPVHGAGAGPDDRACSASPTPRWSRSASAPTSRWPTRSAARSARPSCGSAATPSRRPVRRTVMKNVLLHGLPPRPRDGHAGVPLHGLPPGPDDLATRRSPRPATGPSPRPPAARSARRSACPRTVVQQVTPRVRRVGHPADLRAGQDDLRQRLLRTSAPAPTSAEQVWCPRTVVENVCEHGLRAADVRKQVPYTICKQVPVPRHPAGPGTPPARWSRRSASSRSR